jgi:DNA repair protein RadC
VSYYFTMIKQLIILNIVVRLRDIADLRQEHFICFSLDSNHQIIERRTVFIGTLTGVMAHPREIFAGAITDRALAIVIAHNHPSGNAQPSKQDIALTQQLMAAGQILGVPLHDHIIVAGDKHFSFRKEGLIALDFIAAGEGATYERTTN